VKWHEFTGYWASIGGDAAQMDDNARSKGFQVSSVPHAMSIVIFNNAAGGVGHAGWVTNVYKEGTAVKFDYVDMNGGSGGSAANGWKTSLFNTWDREYGKVWDSSQAFIVAPT
jgi:surface antigen